MAEVHDEVSDAVDVVLRRYIDARSARTGEHRRLLSVQAGKALVILGCTYIGAAVGIEAEVSLRHANELLQHFQTLIKELRRTGKLPKD